MTSVLQNWVCNLSFMQQSVLIAAVRAPDGIRKDHPVKVLMRWYRRCILFSAFDGEVLLTPFSPGGGSFTGPFTKQHAIGYVDLQLAFNEQRHIYLRYVDELPHHFQLHFMHAAEIIGYQHNYIEVSQWWLEFYHMIVNDAHLHPETRDQMNIRLSDNEKEWRNHETVKAL